MPNSTRITADQVTYLGDKITQVFNPGYATVQDMKSNIPPTDTIVQTHGYFSPGDTGGALYRIVSTGTLEGGDISLGQNKIAKLLMKSSFTLATFGVKYADQGYASSNDTAIASAISRCRVAQSELLINGVVYHSKPIVVEIHTVIRGISKGSDPTYTPRFVKVSNEGSGLPNLAYPGLTDTVSYDVDASIIVKRQNAATGFSRGIILEGFLLQSIAKSAYAIYSPHIADFYINVDSRGFNAGILSYVAFLGSFYGRHVGLGSDSTDPVLSYGWRATHFSTVLDCGNSVKVGLSLNNFNRGIQVEYYGNLELDLCTFESISKVTTSAPTSVVLSAPNSTVVGTISCESCSSCLVRATSGSNITIAMSAIFHVTQETPTDGVVHVLSNGRLTFTKLKLFGDAVNQLVINDSGGLLELPFSTELNNVNVVNGDNYRFRDKRFSSSQTNTLTSTTFPNGAEVTFNTLIGIGNSALSGGTIQFNSPSIVKITVVGRSISSGLVNFGLNGNLTESTAAGQSTFMIASVNSGDVLNIKAVGALTLGSSAGIRVFIEHIT